MRFSKNGGVVNPLSELKQVSWTDYGRLPSLNARPRFTPYEDRGKE